MGLGQQPHGLAEIVSAFTEKHRADAPIEVLNGCGRSVPGTFCRPGIGVPFDGFEGLAIVLPVRINHANGAVLDPVPDEIVDVGDGYIELRQDPAPIAHTGANEELVSRSGEREDLAVEIGASIVTPDEQDGILGNIREVAWVLQDDVPPHHHALVVLIPEQVVNAPDVADIHAPHANARRQFSRWSGAQPIGLIAAHVEPRKWQQRADLRIEIIQESVGFVVDRREYIGRFTQRRVFGMAQDLPEVAERLLIAKNIEMQWLHIINQCRQLLWSERAVGRADLRMLLERELILHVVGHEVQLEVGGQAGLEFQGVQRGTGTAGQVILEAAPAQRRPVADLQAGKRVPLPISPDQLAQRLQATEQPRRISCRTDNFPVADIQGMTLGRGLLWQSRQDQRALPGGQTEGRNGRLKLAYSHSAQASPLQLGIQELCRQRSLTIGNFEGQGLFEGKATCFQCHALGKWDQTQVLRCTEADLRHCGDRHHQQGARAAQEGECTDHESSP